MGNFWGAKYSWLSNFSHAWLPLALQVKVGKVASFVGKIFVARPSTTKTTNILPTKITRYTNLFDLKQPSKYATLPSKRNIFASIACARHAYIAVAYKWR